MQKLWGKQKLVRNFGYSLCILATFEIKKAYPEAALPIGLQSSPLYFWNQWNHKNGITYIANAKYDFYFSKNVKNFVKSPT